MRPPHLDELRRLSNSDCVRDRAFAGGALSLLRPSDEVRALYDALRCRALAAHAETRARIRGGALRGVALRDRIEAEPLDAREHWIEEVLDVAYPPLDEPPPEPDLAPYVPSGLGEILHALDVTRLGPPRSFVDVGAGLGKVALLAGLLTGARVRGVERDPALAGRARRSAEALALDLPIDIADAREVDLRGDVVYLYAPFSGAVLAEVMAQIARAPRPITVCAPALDLRAHPWLREAAPARSWLHVYAG